MTSSDIIAIVAMVISAIVSIVSGIISYKNNKANIEAKRSDMAFEKQIEAFREIAETIAGIRRAVASGYKLNTDDEKTILKYFDQLETAFNAFYVASKRSELYLPPDLKKVLNSYGPHVGFFVSERDFKSEPKFLERLNKMEPEIIALMNKHIGLNK